MYIFKGFAAHASFSNNTPGIVAPFGEISTQSLTYSREKGIYKSAVSVDILLTSFLSAAGGIATVTANPVVDHIVTVVKHIYDKAIATSGQIFPDVLLSELLTTYGSVASNFECGIMVNDGTHYVPEWISWRNTSIPSINNPDNVIKVWLSDASFQQQYDEFEIVVVPPIDILDDFFRPGNQVETIVKSILPAEMMARIQAAKGTNPESFIRAMTYDYVDPALSTHRVPTTWNLLIYGLAGNNEDSISDALSTYILAHSTHPRSEWVTILPDLFKRTEFVLIPLWNQYGIPNREIETGIYSPVAKFGDTVDLIKQVLPSYGPAHIDAHSMLMSNPFKSLQIGVIGSIENRNNWYEITQVFSDYINVSSTSLDFGRMSQATQDWSTMLAQMLVTAEYMTAYSTIPVGMTRIKRNGILYLVKPFNNINYLVAAKSTLPNLAPPQPQN
jgi:hypothetical protein